MHEESKSYFILKGTEVNRFTGCTQDFVVEKAFLLDDEKASWSRIALIFNSILLPFSRWLILPTTSFYWPYAIGVGVRLTAFPVQYGPVLVSQVFKGCFSATCLQKTILPADAEVNDFNNEAVRYLFVICARIRRSNSITLGRVPWRQCVLVNIANLFVGSRYYGFDWVPT